MNKYGSLPSSDLLPIIKYIFKQPFGKGWVTLEKVKCQING